jgi:hypothetical protein
MKPSGATVPRRVQGRRSKAIAAIRIVKSKNDREWPIATEHHVWTGGNGNRLRRVDYRRTNDQVIEFFTVDIAAPIN